jgi:hypothetical protein
LGSSEGGTSANLGTTTTGLGACSVAGPAGDLAINGASVGEASGDGGEDRAREASRGLDKDGTGLGLVATTAGLGAGVVFRPAGDLAVDGAGLQVAGTLFFVGASVTTMLGSDVNVVPTRLDATATGLGAGLPGVPGVFTVDGARVSVAVLRGRDGGAHLAAVSDVGDNGASTLFYAAAAKFGASGESSPAGEHAVDGAGLGVAHTVLSVHGTLDTSERNVGDDGTNTRLGASRASHCASGPFGEIAHLAVAGALKSVAGLVVLSTWASSAAVLILGDNRAHSLLVASRTAGGVAAFKVAPSRDLAVGGASESAAIAVGRHTEANYATVGNVSDNGARLGLGAEATGLGAGRELGPAREHAVNRTTEGRARFRALCGGAGSTQ